MDLLELDTDLWATEAMFPLGMGLHLPVRSHVVRLADGGLVLFNPTPTLTANKAAIDALGPVCALVSQSAFHHLGIAPALAAWPDAKLYGPAALVKKRQDLSFDATLGETPEDLWAGQFDQHLVAGAPRIGEVAFFHRATRTLLLCDLVFNVQRPEKAWSRFVFGLTKSWGHFGFSRLIRSTFENPIELRRSLDTLLSWEPQRVAVCHGDPVDRDATTRLREAFASIKG